MSDSRTHPGTTRLGAAALALAAALGFAAAPARAQGFGGTVEDILTRADLLLAQQRANEAVVQYQEARTLCVSPAETVSSLLGEGKARLTMREYLPAAGLFEEALQRFPEDPRKADLLYLAGFARNQGGDLAGAAIALRQALDSQPTPEMVPNIRFWLARAIRLSGKPDEVIPILSTFETDFPTHPLIPKALYYLALAQHDSRDLAGSETTYRHLIDSYPHTQETLESFFDLGQVLSERGKRVEAIEFLRRYSNANPSSSLAARSMELAGDLSLLHSPKEAALYYGVARVKASANETPGLPELQVSRWLATKTTIAGALSQVWVLVVLAALTLLLIGGAGWLVMRRLRGRAAPAAGEPSSA